MSEFQELPVSAVDTRLPHMYACFSNNVADMIEAARERNVPVLLSTIAVNLRNWPPLGSEPAPLDANAAYAEGEGLDAAGKFAEADAAFLRARDLDTRRIRADSHINQILRDLAAAHPGHVRLVDAEREFLAARADDRLFLEHVHLTFEGKARLGALIATGLRDLIPALRTHSAGPPPTTADLAANLLYTPFDERDIWNAVGELTATPMFASQRGHEQRIILIRNALHAAEEASRSFGTAGLVTAAQMAVQRRPDDEATYLLLGRHLLEIGMIPQAIEALSMALTIQPFHPELHLNLGRALRQRGLVAEAERPVREALSLKPDFVPALLELGANLGQQGRLRPALHATRRAIRLQPSRADSWAQLAHILALMPKLDSAIEAARRTMELDPANPHRWNDLAWLLARRRDATRNDLAESITLARRAVAADPAQPYFRGTLAAALAASGAFAEAALEADGAVARARAAGLAEFARETSARAEAYRKGMLPDLK